MTTLSHPTLESPSSALPPARHALAQLHLHLRHPALTALEAEGAAQLLRLAAGEARGHHRDAQQLLLEERHAERARQDRLEARVRVRDRLAAAPAADVGMHHVADDRARADDGDLHHEVVETLGMDARQRRHLGAALHLEHPDRVRALEHAVHGLVVGGQVREVDHPTRLAHERDGFLEHRHHPKTEKIHFHDAERGAIVLVPLHDHAARHRGRLERHHVVEAAGGDDHAARVLAEMPGQILKPRPEGGELADARMPRVAARLLQVACQHRLRILVTPVLDEPGEPVLHVAGQPERLADFAGGAAPAVRDDVRRHPCAEPAVAPVHVLDDRLASLAARQVEVDVRPLAARLREETLEEQLHLHRIDGRDAERIADRAVGGGAAALHEDVVGAAELHDVPDDEEVAGEIEPADDLQLVGDLPPRALDERAGGAVSRAHAARDEVAQVRLHALAGRQRERSEEHTSELSHLGISYAVFCLKKKNSCYAAVAPSATTTRGLTVAFSSLTPGTDAAISIELVLLCMLLVPRGTPL